MSLSFLLLLFLSHLILSAWAKGRSASHPKGSPDLLPPRGTREAPAAAGAAVAPRLPLLPLPPPPPRLLGAAQEAAWSRAASSGAPRGAGPAASTAEWASVSICRSTRMAKSTAPTKPIC
uniref:Fibroblast growth factor 5 short isoform n=1 Tax=Bos taurus TaxID=9913 RepID=A0MTF3_BOVIN|nr:fibroblast growth factor 5 short isoform [Bos taurus]